MDERTKRKRSFDEIGDEYDRVRPGYPEQLVDDVIALASMGRGSRALEIGCGTGKASVAFAERGLSMLCLEPGPRLAAIARGHLAKCPAVRVEESTFEGWSLHPASFDLVFSAQAFHWVDREVRCARAADALRPGGTLALFWNVPVEPGGDLGAALQAAYAAHAPELVAPGEPEETTEDEIDASGRFGTVLMSRYCQTKIYSADDYAAVMGTQSTHRILPPPRRAALLEALAAAVRDAGGAVTMRYVTRLYLARRDR